jgi:hypothetical protein
MTWFPWLVVLLTAANSTPEPAPRAFELLDVESVDGRPVNRYRFLELGATPVRPVTWDVAPPPGVQYGLALVGPQTGTALAVAWDPAARALWLDADGDRRLTRAERHEIKPGTAVAIAGTIAAPEPVRRTILVRPGLLGGGPRLCVHGCMAGELDLGGKRIRALLLDGNADGCFDAAGADQVCVDLDGDGHFDPATEQFPLGSPIRVGPTSYTVASDPWAGTVAAHERDNRVGRLRLGLGVPRHTGKLESFAANLVSQTGEFVTVEALDTSTETPVGRYRIAGLTLELAEPSGRVWIYTFRGGRGTTIDVAPERETRAVLLQDLAFEITVSAEGDIRPGDDVDATPHLQLASGLYLANCTTRVGEASWPQPRSAAIVLLAPGGTLLDRAVSGFA